MPTLIDQVMQSPQLALYQRRIEDALRAEQDKRRAYYEQITEARKVEFVNGQVIFQSPVRWAHDRASNALFALLRTHILHQGLGYAGHEKLLVSLTRNDYEPDICFWEAVKAAKFQPGQMQFPAPDFIAEVLSESTESIDRGVKFEDYAAHGVGEYWIVDADQQIVEQYWLKGEQYELLFRMNSGRLQSRVVAGFDIPVRAIFDEGENLETLASLLSMTKGQGPA